MIECVTIQLPDRVGSRRRDACCSRAVVEKCQLTESFARLVSLEVRGFGIARENLSAVKRTTLQDAHEVTLLIAFLNDDVSSFSFHFLNSIDDDIQLILLERGEHEGLAQPFLESGLLFS